MDLMSMDLISCIEFKTNNVDVYRDKHGKYYVRVNGSFTQKRLVANEIVRYLCNAMHSVSNVIKNETSQVKT